MVFGIRGRMARPGLVSGVALVLLASTGCVERRYTIRTDPPGAIAIVNGEEVGPTPVSRSFTFYGDREINLELDGYETLHVIQPVNSPWWDLPGIDFFSENVLPITLRDEQEFAYKMVPATNPPENELVDRAQGLRAQAQIPPPQRRTGFLGWLGL